MLEPTEQFAPTAWTGSARSARTTSAGDWPRNVAPSSVKAAVAAMGRSLRERIAATARRDLLEIGEGLHDECVDAALEEALRLLAERGARLVGLERAERRQVLAEGADGSEDEGVAPRALPDVAREVGAAPVDLAHAAREAVDAELEAVGAEGVRLDAVGAGQEVLGVDGLDEARLVER